MVSKKYLILLLLSIMVFCSCNNNGHNDSKVPFVQYSGDTLNISIESNKEYTISINVQDETISSTRTNKSISYPLKDLVRKCNDKKEIALLALHNGNKIPIKVKISELVDTLINYQIEPYYDEESVFSISGQCAPLVSKFSSPTQSVDLKKWLFRRKEFLNDDQVRLFSGLLNQLSKSKTTDYITNDQMPVLHSFAGIKYNVKSNIEGDYFVLYACQSSKDIEEFVEDVVANNFELCTRTSSGSMNCYRKTDKNGYLCICLIAIKKDWSYKVQPLGLVAIDNVVLSQNDNDISSFSFPKNQKVLLPSNKPLIYGICRVINQSGGGNGIECNVSFRIYHSGDIKSVTVKRTKKLCYDSWTHKVMNKVINVKDVSNPYSFTMMLHLVDGDNFIPVVIEDNHGNKTEFELNEIASFTRSNAPSIDIDNNINIYD